MGLRFLKFGLRVGLGGGGLFFGVGGGLMGCKGGADGSSSTGLL